ncbi:MAG: hypothetical protein BA863_01715 [Desulfovibrio sp. S3730MH75]|nr:MAG: hypothetical protein BA863_01715 [Desulfovibrio sp. S3730MH75]
MPNELVNEVYIEPIKSVLFIDDMFPTYAGLIQNKEDLNEGAGEIYKDDDDFDDDASAERILENTDTRPDDNEKDTERQRALRLTESCRNSGFIFDVEKDPVKVLEKFPEFLNKPDLIVLDYILEPQTNSSDKSIKILKKLSNSDRFNLVILHSTKDPSEILPKVAYALRGKLKVETSKGLLRQANKIEDQLLQDNALLYLNSAGRSADTWRDRLKIKHDVDDFVCKIANLALENYFEKRYPNTADDNSDILTFECSTKAADPYWVKGQNVFVAIVKKNSPDDSSINDLLAHLKTALADYAPTPINMLLRKGINAFRSANIEALKSVVSDSKTRAAIVYHSMAAPKETPEGVPDLELRISDLSRKAFTAFAESVHASVGSFGEKLYQYTFPNKDDDYSSDEIISTAITKEKANKNTKHFEIALALNAFLCSEEFHGIHLTNGVVFRVITGKPQYFICATPSCDMVPRESNKSGCYRKKLYPASCFEALHIKLLKGKDRISTLQTADQCKHVFLSVDGEVYPFEVIRGGGAGEPRPHIFYSQQGNFIGAGNQLKISAVDNDKDNELKLNEVEIEVVGKLRSEYADRFLHQKGSYNSRIGVDFLNYTVQK